MQNSLKILGGIALIAAVGGCSSSGRQQHRNRRHGRDQRAQH
jgi:hypothetical protein